MLGRLVDYGSDDDAPEEAMILSNKRSSSPKLISEANEKGKKRSAEDVDLPVSKAPKLSDKVENSGAQTIAANRLRVNAKSLLSVLPEPTVPLPAKRASQLAPPALEATFVEQVGANETNESAAANSQRPAVGPAKPDSDAALVYPYYPEYAEMNWQNPQYQQQAHEMHVSAIDPSSSWARELARSGGQIVEVNARQIYDPTTRQQEAGEYEPMIPQRQFSKTAKQRHQLSTLAAQSRSQEKQLAAKKAQGMKSKAETRAKYGW